MFAVDVKKPKSQRKNKYQKPAILRRNARKFIVDDDNDFGTGENFLSNPCDISIDMADYQRKQIFPAALFNDTHIHIANGFEYRNKTKERERETKVHREYPHRQSFRYALTVALGMWVSQCVCVFEERKIERELTAHKAGFKLLLGIRFPNNHK